MTRHKLGWNGEKGTNKWIFPKFFSTMDGQENICVDLHVASNSNSKTFSPLSFLVVKKKYLCQNFENLNSR
jgi:hypothetical protein